MPRPRALDTASPVRALLAASGLSPSELAAAAGVTRQAISDSCVRGAGVSVEVLIKLCKAGGGSLRLAFVPGDGAP